MSNDTVVDVPIGATENANAIFITYTAIITMALIPIYIGSYRSLTSKLSVSGCSALHLALTARCLRLRP